MHRARQISSAKGTGNSAAQLTWVSTGKVFGPKSWFFPILLRAHFPGRFEHLQKKCALGFTLLLLLHLAAAPSCAQTTSFTRRRPRRVELPQGDPLFDPLEFAHAEASLFRQPSDILSEQLHGANLIDAALIACGCDGDTPTPRASTASPAFCRPLSPRKRIACPEHCHLLASSPLHPLTARTQQKTARFTSSKPSTKPSTTNCSPAAINPTPAISRPHYKLACTTAPAPPSCLLRYAMKPACKPKPLNSPATSGPLSPAATSGSQSKPHARIGPAHSERSPLVGAGRMRMPTTILSPAHLFTSSPAHCPVSEAASRPLSRAALLAMLYYNRAIDAFQHERFADAVVLNRKSLLLDGDNPTARGNLLAAVNNWALALAAAGRFDEAQSLLTAGRRYAPDHEPFAHNAAHIHRLQAESAISISPSPLGRGSG